MSRAVLIVNSFDGREMYAERLRAQAVEVIEAERPEDALLRIASEPPAVIVTDMVFTHSRYSGPEFMRAVRNNPACANVLVIVLSGFVRQLDHDVARDAGADLFLHTPCDPDMLFRHVTRALIANRRGKRLAWNWPQAKPDRRVGDRRRRQRRRTA